MDETSEAARRIQAAAARSEAEANEPEPDAEGAEEEESNPPTDPTQEPGAEPTEGPEAPNPDAPAGEPGEQAQPDPGATPSEPAPGPPAALGAENTEQVVELEKAQTTYLRKVEKIIGTQAMPPLCPACEGTGLDFTGGEPEPELKASPDRERCPDCDGWGKVVTGSRVPTEEVLPCPTCQGAGHRVVLHVPPLPAAPATATAAVVGQSWMGDPTIGGNGH